MPAMASEKSRCFNLINKSSEKKENVIKSPKNLLRIISEERRILFGELYE